MTSDYSSIPIETELVTNFRVYKIAALYKTWNAICFKIRFAPFTYRNVTKLCRNTYFGLVTLLYQVNFQYLLILFVLRNKR